MNDEQSKPDSDWSEHDPYELEEPDETGATGRGKSSAVKHHTCSVTMPDGTGCSVSYCRIGPKAHRFDFAAPINQRCWPGGSICGVGAIEVKAAELAPEAFRLAQAREQEQMRCKTRPWDLPEGPRQEPQLRPKDAERKAGRYAVCIRFKSGRVMQIGTSFDDPERATADLLSGAYKGATLFAGQSIAVFICCRFMRRWVEPRFLASRHVIEPPPAAQVKKPRRSRRAAAAKVQTAKASPAAKATHEAKPTRPTKPKPSTRPKTAQEEPAEVEAQAPPLEVKQTEASVEARPEALPEGAEECHSAQAA